MAISFDFTKSPVQSAAAGTAKQERPKAQFWMNVGYEVDVIVKDASGKDVTETRFISLPMGMPLDTMEKLPVKSSNNEFRALQSARNHLLEQVLEAAKTMKPGETQLVNLQIELRRVNDEQEAIPADVNPFIRELKL